MLVEGTELETNGEQYLPGDPFEVVLDEHPFDDILHVAGDRVDFFVELQLLVL